MVRPKYVHVKAFILVFFVITNDTYVMGRGKNSGADAYWQRYAKLSGTDTKDLAVAVKAGVSTSTLSSWKTANRFPPANAAVKIAQFFCSTVEYMVEGKESGKEYSDLRLLASAKNHKDILECLDLLDPATLETVKIQVKAVALASGHTTQMVAEKTP